MRDGHLNKCKECTKKDVHDRYNDPEAIKRIKAYERKRNKTVERRRKRLEYGRKRRMLHPDKARANHAVSNAIRNGRLKRESCEVCGKKKSEAHHPDYSKPLSVKWLCLRHHREEHKNIKKYYEKNTS